MTTADRELVARFVANADEHSFKRLYAAHTPRLYLSLLRLCGGRESEAEDLLQETWTRAARAPGVPTDTLPDETPDAATDTNDGEAALDLEREVRRLPDGYREVLVLPDVEGHTHDEIAGMLGITAGTSKSQLSRAREHLRRRLSTESVHNGREKQQ